MFSTKDTSYQADIGAYQGADFIFFDNTAVGARAMRNLLRSLMTVTDQPISGSVLENSLFSPVYGFHYFSAPTGQSLCSMKLPLPSEGMKLVLDFGQCAGDANISIMASTAGGVTGVSLVRATGSALSTVLMSAGGRLELICTTDGTWSIVGANASVTEQASS